jgi:hypothetical protein
LFFISFIIHNTKQHVYIRIKQTTIGCFGIVFVVATQLSSCLVVAAVAAAVVMAVAMAVMGVVVVLFATSERIADPQPHPAVRPASEGSIPLLLRRLGW